MAQILIMQVYVIWVLANIVILLMLMCKSILLRTSEMTMSFWVWHSRMIRVRYCDATVDVGKVIISLQLYIQMLFPLFMHVLVGRKVMQLHPLEIL